MRAVHSLAALTSASGLPSLRLLRSRVLNYMYEDTIHKVPALQGQHPDLLAMIVSNLRLGEHLHGQLLSLPGKPHQPHSHETGFSLAPVMLLRCLVLLQSSCMCRLHVAHTYLFFCALGSGLPAEHLVEGVGKEACQLCWTLSLGPPCLCCRVPHKG